MEEDRIYSDKYKRTARKLSLGMMIFVLIVSVIILGVGLFLAIYFKTTTLIVLGVIMCVVAILDSILAIRFYIVTKRRIAKMKDREAIDRYKRIHGIK